MKRVALLGGSFNPIHLGHIALAQAVVEQQLADEVWLVVSPQNPLKQTAELLDERKRLFLVQKAVDGLAHIHVSEIEFLLPKPSYTWQTLEALATQYPSFHFSLLIGGDNWANFRKWARWEQILERYEIIVYPRVGSSMPSPLPQSVHLLEAPLHEVSSTQVREAIVHGAPLHTLLPACIIEDCKAFYCHVK
ncbi:MAG: nicotinate (nicotinamide) nucleotide adenylyltransferase [Bacteroidales bacterium]|nr:nicotinate (nicotinamide) nucleotide adenylyltransferase [Bacteroidales bacterium]